MTNPKRAIALLLSLFVLIMMGGFVSLATYQYVSDRIIHQHYENSIRSLYAIETARSILLWEENHKTPVNTWDTRYDSRSYPGTTIDEHKFYRLTNINGFNIKAKAFVITGCVYMYIMAYKGDENSPQEAQYLEYIHSPAPMYKYAMFSNTSLIFSGSKLYDMQGGSIHTNGDIEFKPTSSGLRFNNLGQMTASGTIKYGQRYSYPAPHVVDNIDSVIDGMAPAPAPSPWVSDHYKTTTGETAIPGPYRRWSLDTSTGTIKLAIDSYADYVGGNWGQAGPAPLILRGDETYFYGKQNTYGSYYFYNTSSSETSTAYLGNDGAYYTSSGSNTATDVYNYNFTSGSFELRTDGYYNTADVYFRPSTTADGSSNDTWFELPGSLPQTYSWTNKYTSLSSTETPVTLYVTEGCSGATSAFCNVDTTVDSGETSGWRYMKKDKDGNVCATDACYEDADNVYDSNYVKAQDYSGSGDLDWTKFDAYAECYWAAECNLLSGGGDECENECYWKAYEELCCPDGVCDYSNCDWDAADAIAEACIISEDCAARDAAFKACQDTCIESVGGLYIDEYYETFYSLATSLNQNAEFFNNNYTYGNDAVTGVSTATTSALNTQKQSSGLASYLNLLSQKNITGVVDSGVEKKDPFLGNLFDTTSSGDSAYKTKAAFGGMYLSETTGLSSVVSALNGTLDEEDKFAAVDSFYNWKTGEITSVINIDVEKMNAAISNGGASFSNGVIYSEVPIMLSNAEELPGVNSSDKTAVFTLVSEESIYLKGNYNTDNWKISNIATQKKVYTLSNAFSADALPDTPAYLNYPYVKVTVHKTDGIIDAYTGIASDQTGEAGTNEVWIDATLADDKTPDGSTYLYYHGMDTTLRGDNVTDAQSKNTNTSTVIGKKNVLQANYVSSHTSADGTTTFPNTVDIASYSYNSLFITPYDVDVLENWKYQTGTDSSGKPTYATATRSMLGAFINFYSPGDTRYDDEYKASLDGDEYCTKASCSSGFDYRTRKAPVGYLSWQNITSPNTIQAYDGRFPTASPVSSEGILGFTGQNSWRAVSKEYFDKKTSS